MFKEMSTDMSDEEVKRCMAILIDGSIVLKIKRNTKQNFIRVVFRLVGHDKSKKYKVLLLPDTIQELSKSVNLRHDAIHLYQQYMIAKKYSEYWKSNIFIDE
ncbi:MAG: hypothetical protein NC412_05140 [Roseburia sp.]|nr:hypothetical protein [Roseburia sp.]MCM1277601.1 hypothetical protein [Robinsoniella sp.]